jgi:alpha-L-fucosidase
VLDKGGGWYARSMYREDSTTEAFGKDVWAYHRQTYGYQSKVVFKDICHLWKADHFDADAVQGWGTRFVMILASHHENFDSFLSYSPARNSGETTFVIPKIRVL